MGAAPASNSSTRSPLPAAARAPSPSITSAEHALAGNDIVEDVSIRHIEDAVVQQAPLEIQFIDPPASSTSKEDEKASPCAPSGVPHSLRSFSDEFRLIYLLHSIGYYPRPSCKLSAQPTSCGSSATTYPSSSYSSSTSKGCTHLFSSASSWSSSSSWQ